MNFISYDDSSKEVQRRNAKLARSHVAKTLNERRRLKAAPGAATKANSRQTGRSLHDEFEVPNIDLAIRPPATSPQQGPRLPRERRPSIAEDHGPVDQAARSWSAGNAYAGIEQSEEPNTLRQLAKSLYVVPEAFDGNKGDGIVRKYTFPQPALRRTISPLLGAFESSTFQDPSDLSLNRMTHHLVTVQLPKIRGAEGIAWRLKAMCHSPVLYHATVWSVAVHKDLLREKLHWSATKSALMHKHRCIQLIQEGVEGFDELTSLEAEALIVAVVTMAVCEIQPGTVVRETGTYPFRPHWPSNHDQDIYRVQGVRAHLAASSAMAERMGGLPLLQKDSAYNLAFCDLIMSLSDLRKPVHPSLWQVNNAALQKLAIRRRLPDIAAIGVGFRKLPGSLPPEAESVFRSTAILDRLMNLIRSKPQADPDFNVVRTFRDALGHRLASLPSWGEMTEAERSGHHSPLYELCRMTAGLYTAAVIYARPPYSRWLVTYVARIRAMFEKFGLHLWVVDAGPLLTWALVIGGIAALKTRHRAFFRRALRLHARLAGIHTWHDAHETVRDFLWDDAACAPDAEMLWKETYHGVRSLSEVPKDGSIVHEYGAECEQTA